jgi:hypothetical protein
LLARVGRTLAVAVTAAGLLVLPVRAGAAATGCSPAGPCVAIHEWIGGSDTTVRELSGTEVDAAADHTTTTCYDTRVNPGSATTCHNVSNALSIHALLAGTPDQNSPGKSLADTANFTATPRSGGSWSLLTHPELQGNTSGTFEHGLLPVIHSIGQPDGGPIEYVRPLTTDPNDANAQDIFTLGDTSTLVINVFTGPLLDVSVTTKSTHVQVGKPVSFTATASDHGTAVSPKSLTYSWSFGDGGTAATQDPTHRFKTAGTWLVMLTAAGRTDGSGGISTPLQITAGPPPTKTSPSPTPGPDKSPSPSPPSSPGPVTSSTATPRPDPSPHPGSGHGGGGSGSGPTIPNLDNGAVSRLFSRLSGQGAGQQPKVASGTDELQLISGQIVGAGEPLSGSQAASESANLATPPVDGETTRWTPGVVPIYVAVILLLLGIGIARERGWLTLRRR